MTQFRRFVLVLALGSMLWAAQTCRAVSIQIETVGPMSERNQAAWWSPIVHRDGDVYVSYLAPNSPQDDVFVAKRAAGGAWSLQDTGVNAVYDVGHTQASMAIDGQGYLHVAYGMHNHPMRIVASNQPQSITDGFSSLSPNDASVFAGGAYTYPNLTTSPNGDVYMIVRDRRASYADQHGRLFRFDNAARAWGELPPFAGQNGTTVYPDHVIADAAGDLHIIWEWAAGGAQGARHYGTYARFDPDANTYYRADGTAYPPGPITIGAADIYQGLEGSETFQPGVHGVQSAKMVLDDEGRPLVAYGYSTDGTASGYQHRFAHWTGTDWTHNTITPGPFDIDKPWISYSNGLLRYYGTLSPSHPMHTGSDDIFVRTSNDYGASWSDPIAVTSGLDVQRPVGITVGNTDYLYLPSTSAGTLSVGLVNWDHAGSALPYLNNFDATGLAFSSSAFSLDSGAGILNYAAGGGLAIGTASESIDEMGESDFVISTRFTLDEASGSGNQVTTGFGAFGSTGNFSSVNGNAFYLADWGVTPHSNWGKLRILALGDDSDFAAVDGDSDGTEANGASVVVGNTYELRLTGDYAGEALNLTLSLFDENGQQIGTSATASDTSPLDGSFFGYRSRTAGPDHALRMSYDRFYIGAAPALPGDYNNDGTVDAADYVVWRRHNGSSAALPNEDPQATPGDVSHEDYLVWRALFGQNAGDGAAAVPEPSLSLAAFCAAMFLGLIGDGRR